jgi:hypothetical protein
VSCSRPKSKKKSRRSHLAYAAREHKPKHGEEPEVGTAQNKSKTKAKQKQNKSKIKANHKQNKNKRKANHKQTKTKQKQTTSKRKKSKPHTKVE